MKSSYPGLRARGFSLIEMVVTVAVLAILVTIAVPSFQSVINSNRLATAANELATSLQLARTEAVRRNQRVVVCASGDPGATAPTCAAGAWDGWITFVDLDRSGQRNGSEPLLRASEITSNAQIVAGDLISGAADRIVFSPDGLAYASSGALLTSGINVCISTSQPEINGRNVQIRSGSSISVEQAAPDPDCPGYD